MTTEEINRQIEAIKKATQGAASSKAKSDSFLREAGIVRSGEQTKVVNSNSSSKGH